MAPPNRLRQDLPWRCSSERKSNQGLDALFDLESLATRMVEWKRLIYMMCCGKGLACISCQESSNHGRRLPVSISLESKKRQKDFISKSIAYNGQTTKILRTDMVRTDSMEGLGLGLYEANGLGSRPRSWRVFGRRSALGAISIAQFQI